MDSQATPRLNGKVGSSRLVMSAATKVWLAGPLLPLSYPLPKHFMLEPWYSQTNSLGAFTFSF